MMQVVPLEHNDYDQVISYDSNNKPYSYYSDDKWILWSFDCEVSFSNFFGNFKKDVKYIVWNFINDKNLKSLKSTIKIFIGGAVTFQSCISACEGESFSFIDDDSNYRLFLQKAKDKKKKFKTWKNNLIFMSHARTLGIIKRNISNFEELASYISVNGRSSSQTLCIPENIALEYYKQALNFIEKYYPYRHLISFIFNEFFEEYKQTAKSYKSNVICRRRALEKVDRVSKENIPDIYLDFNGSWLSKLKGACYMVIAAFTGCRDGEIKSLDIDSYQEKKYAGITIPLVYGYDTKPNVGGVKRRVYWVTIPAVRKAIELAWFALDFARKEWLIKANHIKHLDERKAFLDKANSLFITLPHLTSTKPNVGKQGISDYLESFTKSTQYFATEHDVKEFDQLNPSRIGELKVGNILKVNPHAFRRTFAVYLVRNKIGSLLDIKYQFKHMNITMTSWYANNANIASYDD